jgi:hypothetical protein
MQRKDVIRLRDANAEKVYFANYALRVLRVLMEHCVDLGWRDDNPAKGVSELKRPESARALAVVTSHIWAMAIRASGIICRSRSIQYHLLQR